MQADSLSGFHANTHIPVVIGTQMRYEVTGDPLYKVFVPSWNEKLALICMIVDPSIQLLAVRK